LAQVGDGVLDALHHGGGRLLGPADERAHGVPVLVAAVRPVRRGPAVDPAADVHVTVRTHEQAVGDIRPAVAGDVVALDAPHSTSTVRVGVVDVGGADVVDAGAAP